MEPFVFAVEMIFMFFLSIIFSKNEKNAIYRVDQSRLNCNSTWARIPGGGVADLHFFGK